MQLIDIKDLLIAQIEKSQIEGKEKWDLICVGAMSFSFLIYITPLSGLLQRGYRLVFAGIPITQQIDTPQTNQLNLPNKFTGEFAQVPKKGEKINGYVVTSSWGHRNTDIPGASTFHEGVDLGMPIGTPVFAVASPGEKVEVKCWFDKGGGGYVASYKTRDGIGFDYLHLSHCSSRKFQAGSAIALSGDTGVGNGPHLHVTMRDKNGKKIPPQRGYLWWITTGEKPNGN